MFMYINQFRSYSAQPMIYAVVKEVLNILEHRIGVQWIENQMTEEKQNALKISFNAKSRLEK